MGEEAATVKIKRGRIEVGRLAGLPSLDGRRRHPPVAEQNDKTLCRGQLGEMGYGRGGGNGKD